jgi:hypothetical protein
MMRYKYDQQVAAATKDGDEAPEAESADAESPLHVPLGDGDDDEGEGEGVDGGSGSDESFVSNDDFKSFYSNSEAGTASEYAFSARGDFSRGVSPISWRSGDSPSMSGAGSPAYVDSPRGDSPSMSGAGSPAYVDSPVRGGGKREPQEPEEELDLGFKDFDLESTFDLSASFVGGDVEKLEKEAVDEGLPGAGLENEVVLGGGSPSGSKSEASDGKEKESSKKGGRWRKMLVRYALLGASAAIAHEKRLQLRATVLKARRRLRGRRGGVVKTAAPTAADTAAAGAAVDEAETAAIAVGVEEGASAAPAVVVAAPPVTVTALPNAEKASPPKALAVSPKAVVKEDKPKPKSSKGTKTTTNKKKTAPEKTSTKKKVPKKKTSSGKETTSPA